MMQLPPSTTLFPYTTLFRSFMNGAQGGMITADVRRDDGGESNTWEECIRIGNLLADEALRIVQDAELQDRKSTRLNSSHLVISYAVFCWKKKKIRATATNVL